MLSPSTWLSKTSSTATLVASVLLRETIHHLCMAEVKVLIFYFLFGVESSYYLWRGCVRARGPTTWSSSVSEDEEVQWLKREETGLT